MKTSLILLAALTAGLATAQQDSKPAAPANTGAPDTQTNSAATDAKKKPKRPKPAACSDIPPDQQVRFHLPTAWEQQLARQRAELERRTGIVLPPPPPPKVLPPCPPPAKPADAGKK
ncbi:MAG TPA: hypothetical protein VMH80_03695 [Bryobacteraceae bacterium]|nr:hypothetical protein [Bryobacteraceae bacterium]